MFSLVFVEDPVHANTVLRLKTLKNCKIKKQFTGSVELFQELVAFRHAGLFCERLIEIFHFREMIFRPL
jgi:hypothetical protein